MKNLNVSGGVAALTAGGTGLVTPSVPQINTNETYDNGGLLGGLGYLGEKLAVGFVSSLEGMWDYTAGGLAKLFGADDWAEEQFANDWFGDWYSHPEEWYNPSDGWRVAGDIAGGIGTSLPSIGAVVGATLLSGGTLTAPTIALVGGGTAGLGAAGNATKEAYRQTGKLGGEEFGYGALVGVTEGAMETVSNVIGMGTGAVVKSLSKAFAKEAAQTVAKNTVIKSLGKSFIGEAFEEGLAEVLDPVFQRMSYNPDAKDATLQEVAYAAFVGGMSGLVMGGADATINTTNSFIKGNKLATSGQADEVIGLSRQIAERETATPTGEEAHEFVAQKYAELQKSLEKTGGKVETVAQKKLLGDLERANLAATFNPLIYSSVANIYNNAEAVAAKVNENGGFKRADGKVVEITAEQIREGIDPKDGKSFSKGVKSNAILRELAVSDAMGHLIMDAEQFKRSAMLGRRLASQVDLNNFIETASAEQKRDAGKALGIDDWSTLDIDTFNQKVVEFVERGGVQEYTAKREAIKQMQSIPAESARPMPSQMNLRKDGIFRYSDGNNSIAVMKNGDTFTIYDYGTQQISRGLTRAEVNEFLKNYNNLKAEYDAGVAAEAERTRQIAEIDEFARENIPDYAKLSAPNQSMIRKVIREGRALGLEEADILSYARVAAHTGLNIEYNSNMKDGDAGYYDPKGNKIVVNPKATKKQELILIHELDHALRKFVVGDKVHTLTYKDADKRLSQETVDVIEKEYSDQDVDVSREALFKDEASAYYTEALLGGKVTVDMLLGKQPTLKQKILSFFAGGLKAYSGDAKLSREAARHYKRFKAMFDAFAERNKGRNAETAAENVRAGGESVRKSANATPTLKTSRYDFTKSFSEQVDDYKNGKFPARDTLIVGATPDVWKQVGFNALPVTINQTHVDYAINGTKDSDHAIGEALLKALPDAIKEPVAIIQSQSPTRPDRAVVILKTKHKGKNVVGAIEVDGEGYANRISIDSNAMTSLFSKTNALQQLKKAVDNTVNGGIELFYWDKKEAVSLLQNAGLQLSGTLPQDGFVHSIHENGSKVNTKIKNITESQQFVRWFGDWKKNSKKASKVVNEDGTPMVVYHGTNSEFWTFEKGHKRTRGRLNFGEGFYFAASKSMAENYVEGSSGKVMEVYVNIKKPYEVIGNSFTEFEMDDIRSKLSAEDRAKLNYDNVNEYLEKLGYDGIIGYNYSGTKKNISQVVAFKSEQIKSATDNIGTFDGQNKDIRYSKEITPEIDSSYLDAVNRGDMETAQRMVDEAAKKAGYTYKGMHGTSADFNTFDYSYIGDDNKLGLGFYFTNNENLQFEYDYKKTAYLKISNPIFDNNPTLDDILRREEDLREKGFTQEETLKAIQNEFGYDGIVAEYNRKALVAFNHKQIKSADPVTYDDNGNVIPLSERFNSRNSDIRYSKDIKPELGSSDKVEISKGRLLQTRANYQSEKVFYKKDVVSALGDIDIMSTLNAKERAAIADRLWQGYLQRVDGEGYALYTKLMEEKLYDELVGKLGDATDDARDLLKRQIKNALDRIVVEGKPSVRAKLLEQAAKESNVAYWKNEYKSLVGRNEVLGALMSKAQKMKDLKMGAFANATQLEAEIFKGSIEKLSKINFRGNLNITGTRKIVADLQKWYVKDNPILQYADERNKGYYDEGVADMLATLANEDGGFTVGDLKTLLNVMSYFTNFVETYNKVWRQGKWQSAPDLAKSYIDRLHKNAKVKVGAVWNRGLRKFVEMFGDPMSLVRRIDLYQDGFFTDMLSDLRDAAVEASVAEMEVRAAYDEFLAKKENKGYIEKASTEKVEYHGTEIPKMHLIGLYMTMKRKHAQEGILYNGFTFKHNNETVRVGGFVDPNAKLKKAEIEAKINTELSNIEKLLSDTDKQYIAILEQGYNADVRKLKVERDMQRLGFTNATEDYYYPIRRADIARNIDVSDIAQEIDRVSNSSFNKDTVKGAKQKLFIESADALYNRHVHAVCQYAYLSPAIETFNVLYNMDTTGNRNDPISVRTESQNTWDTAEQYFRKLISDIQGIPVTATEGAKVFSAIRGGYAKSVLGANPKVWFTQLSSVFASSSILDADSITKGMVIDSSDMDEYCGLAKLRSYDNSAVMAQGNLDSKLRKAKTKIDKFSDMLMLPIGMVDRFVVGRLFGACQVQVEKNGGAKVGTEANKEAAGKLLQKVILETQQNSIATERSRAMRSGSEFMRTITMFTSDSMKVFGRVIDSIGESTVLRKRIKETTDTKAKAELEGQLKAANKRVRKSIGALVTTAAFMAGIAQLFRWLYNKDKEEDETVAGMMTADFVGNLFGGLPVVKDVYSFMVDGFGIENYTYSSINDLMSSTKSLFEASASIISGEATSQDIARSTRSLAYSVSQLLGIPTRNVYNLLYGLTKRVDPATAYKIDNVFYEKNFKTDLYKAVENNDGKMVAMLMDMLYGERMGDELTEAVYNELYALSMDGYKVMPKAVRTSFTYNGEEIALDDAAQEAIRSTYSTCQPALEGLFQSSQYRKLTSEQKQEAINYVYDLYYDDALQYVTGISQGKMVLMSKAVGADTLALLHVMTKGLESDKDSNGKTVSGTKRKKVIAAINSLDASREQKLLLICAKGYSLQDNDVRGLSAENAKKRLLRYILNLQGKTQAEKAAIAELCGFEVKNGKIITKSALFS